MGKLLSLSQLVTHIHSRARALGLLRDGPWDLHELETASKRLLDDSLAPESSRRNRHDFLHFAALALSMGRQPITYQVRSGAARFVAETDLRHVPDAPPALLRRSWIAEVRDPEREALYGDVVGLGYYTPLPDVCGLISFTHSGSAATYVWQPHWSGEEIATERDGRTILCDESGSSSEDAVQAARFAVVLGLLLEAESSPVLVENQPRNRSARRRDRARREAGEWSVRHVYLDQRRKPSSSDHPPHSESAHDGTAGRAASDVIVRGHLKRQRHGPGRKETRWIYVASYEARRWVAPRPVRVVVHGAQDERQAR